MENFTSPAACDPPAREAAENSNSSQGTIVHTCSYTCTDTYMYMHTCTHMHTYEHIHTHISTHSYTYMHISMHAWSHAYILSNCLAWCHRFCVILLARLRVLVSGRQPLTTNCDNLKQHKCHHLFSLGMFINCSDPHRNSNDFVLMVLNTS